MFKIMDFGAPAVIKWRGMCTCGCGCGCSCTSDDTLSVSESASKAGSFAGTLGAETNPHKM